MKHNFKKSKKNFLRNTVYWSSHLQFSKNEYYSKLMLRTSNDIYTCYEIGSYLNLKCKTQKGLNLR